MNNLKDILLVFQNCYALRKLGAENAVKYEKSAVCYSVVAQLMKKHAKMEFFYDTIYQDLKAMSFEQRALVLDSIFDDTDISKITDSKLELLVGKISLVSEKQNLLEEYASFFNEVGHVMQPACIRTLLKNIKDESMTEEDIIRINKPEVLKVIASYNYGDIRGLLAMNDENRAYYIKEYQYPLRGLMEQVYPHLGNMSFSNFQGFVQIGKDFYCSDKGKGRYRYTASSFRFMDAIAKKYGQNKIINFILFTFPECCAILEDGNLPDSFMELMNTITENKSKKELKKLHEKYYQFLSVSPEMRFLRYQTILDEKFIKNPNKNVIMDSLEKQKYNTAKYKRKSMILLEKVFPPHQHFGEELAPFFEEEETLAELERKGELINSSAIQSLDKEEQRLCYQFVMSAPKKELIESRLRLMIVPNFLTSAYRPMILTRMKNVITKQDADKIMQSTELICSPKTTEQEREKYMETLPGNEHIIETEDLLISIYNLESLLENTKEKEIEIYKDSLKLVIRKNNTCKKK